MSKYSDRKKARRRFPLPRVILPGQLGDGYGNVKTAVPNYVYCRISGRIETVYNDVVPAVNDYLVDCGRDDSAETPGIFRVLGTRTQAPAGPNVTVQMVGKHAPSHELFAPNGGTDPIWIDGRQIKDLQVMPAGGMLIQIYQGVVWSGSAYLMVNLSTADMTAHIPASAGQAALVLITVNTSGAIIATKGTEFTLASVATDNAMLANKPATPANTARELALVRVYNGQTAVQIGRDNNDITDLRWCGYYIPSAQDTYYLVTEDLTEQVTGATAHFDLSQTAYGLAHVYANLRQLPADTTMDSDGQGFTLSYTPAVGDKVLVDYYSTVSKIMTDDTGAFILDDTGYVLEAL